MIRALTWLAGILVAAAACADGGELFATFCQSCHGENPEPLQTFSGTRDGFRQVLEDAGEGMPDFYGVFTDDEIDALYDYVTATTIAPGSTE